MSSENCFNFHQRTHCEKVGTVFYSLYNPKTLSHQRDQGNCYDI